MHQAARAASWVVCLVVASGCETIPARVTGNLYGTIRRAPTNPAAVRIYRNFPSEGYVRIGEIEASAPNYVEQPAYNWGVGLAQTKETFEAQLRQKAAELGGDALVMTQDGPVSYTTPTISTESRQDESADTAQVTKTTTQVAAPVGVGRRVSGIVIKFQAGY